jgi:hypothetical protein
MPVLESVGKYKWWIVGAIGAVGAYYIYESYVTSQASGTSDLSSESQYEQSQTAEQLVNDQYQSQLDLTQANAAAQSQVIGATYAGQESLATIGANSYGDYLNTQVALNQSNNDTTLGVANIQSGTYEDIAGMQASLEQSQINDQQANIQYVLNATCGPGTTGSGRCSPTGVTLAELTGQGGSAGAVAQAENGSGSLSPLSGIASGIGAIGKIASTL